jgi:hypothetical protein
MTYSVAAQLTSLHYPVFVHLHFLLVINIFSSLQKQPCPETVGTHKSTACRTSNLTVVTLQQLLYCWLRHLLLSVSSCLSRHNYNHYLGFSKPQITLVLIVPIRVSF